MNLVFPPAWSVHVLRRVKAPAGRVEGSELSTRGQAKRPGGRAALHLRMAWAWGWLGGCLHARANGTNVLPLHHCAVSVFVRLCAALLPCPRHRRMNWSPEVLAGGKDPADDGVDPCERGWGASLFARSHEYAQDT